MPADKRDHLGPVDCIIFRLREEAAVTMKRMVLEIGMGTDTRGAPQATPERKVKRGNSPFGGCRHIRQLA